ncbi:MAG TPA: FAD-dependent oxidoreductase [Gemmatimonadales bacterium]
MIHTYDAVIVGAGPAGSATAALLAERGHTVALLDRAHFPRPKPCAEYLSPEAGRILERLGVLGSLRAAGAAELAGMRVVGPGGMSFTGRFAGRGTQGFPRFSDVGLAIRREVLDATLLDAARARNVTVLEGLTARSLGVTPAARTVLAQRDGTPVAIAGRLVIGADGLNSRVAAVLGLTRRRGRPRVAFVTHARGVQDMSDVGEIHVGPGGYAGLASVGDGITNVAVVTGDAGAGGGARERLRQLLAGYPEVTRRVANATWVSPVRAVGPFGRWTPRASAARALLVGDAADFHDPVTGEGVYAALRGAELAAEHADLALRSDRLEAAAFAEYDRDRRRVFGGKWLVERLIGWAIATPAVLDHAARRLRDRPELADLLIGVTGDFVPARQILTPSFLWRLAW